MTIINKESIKEQISLAELADSLGHTPTLKGNVYTINPCPACGHNDCCRWPKNKDLFKCFSGACNAGGDVFSMYAMIRNTDFKESLTGIADLFPAVVDQQNRPGQGRDPQPTGSSCPPEPASQSPDIFQATMEFYEENRHHNHFAAWLDKRKYKKSVITDFHIGFADPKRSLNRHLTSLGYTEQDMLTAGLVLMDEKHGKLYDLFYKTGIIFPYLDHTSKPCHFKSKPVDLHGNHTGNPYQLKTTDQTPVFFGMQQKPAKPAKPAKKNNPLHIVEGETDVLAMACLDISPCWALGKRMSGVQREYIGSLLEAGYNIVAGFDADPAGQEYLNQLRRYATMPDIILNMIVDPDITGKLFYIRPPQGCKDVDEGYRTGDTSWATDRKPVLSGLRVCLAAYRSCLDDNDSGVKWSADTVARILYDWFKVESSWYVRNDEVFLTISDKVYALDTKLPFKSLLYQLAGINYANKSSKAIWEALAAIAYNESPHVDGISWLHNNQDPPSVSWHIGNNTIATMADNRVSTAVVGAAPVMLIESPKMLPLKLIRNIEPATGIEKLFQLATISMGCSRPWRLYLCALLIKSLLLGWSRANGVHNFTGSMGSGKSDVANFLTAMTYGQTFVTAGSTASNYTDATQNPWTVLDNLESRNIGNDVRDFLLHVGTGIVRQKRKAGTDSENVYERAQTQILTTSIEQTETPELIERTIIIPFGHQWFNKKHPGSAVLEADIIKYRDLIWSAIMQLIAEAMPTMAEDRAKHLDWIRNKWPGHSKQRLNEHFATIASVTEMMLAASPYIATDLFGITHVNTAMDYWITEQNVMAADLTAESNPIIRYLDLLETRWRTNESTIEFMEYGDSIQTEIALAALLSEFDLIARQYQLTDKYRSVRHLAVRIVNEREVLLRAGWEIKKKCKINGRQIYTISRNFNENT